MRFDWDDNKNKANQVKHGVSFETASQVFADPLALSIQDRHVGSEERWQTIGQVGGVVVLLVAHAYRTGDEDEVIRIISARKATKRERRHYEQSF